MGRTIRIWNPKVFDHVVMRGNNRQEIFRNESDIEEFFRVLHYTYMKHPFTIIAYCIMTNHYHLLIRSPEVPLGKVMYQINRRYSDYYNKKYNYTGYLYDSRYFAKMVVSPRALLNVSRYIHRNPIETTVPMVDRLEDYPHSSFHLFHSGSRSAHAFLDLELLPSLLPVGYSKTSEGYRQYCEENSDEKEHDLLLTYTAPNH